LCVILSSSSVIVEALQTINKGAYRTWFFSKKKSYVGLEPKSRVAQTFDSHWWLLGFQAKQQ
jgi:hypothetical protein